MLRDELKRIEDKLKKKAMILIKKLNDELIKVKKKS